MKQLSGLDAGFLHLETPQMPMHVGALSVYELPAGYAGDFADDVRAHVAARLPIAPALRRKLAMMPLNLASPVWVDAQPDLERHIVGVHLPAGSGQAELEAEVGRLHAVRLDRARPLWKFHVFDGLAPGPEGEPRFAIYSQLHHAAVDGQAAVALAQALLDLGPEPRAIVLPPVRARRGQLGVAAMLRGAIAGELHEVVTLVKALPSTVGAISQVAAASAGEAAGDALGAVIARLTGEARAAGRGVSNLGLAPRTRLNTTVSAARVFAGASLPLAQVHAVRRRHHASLNDAVLMICSGALRRWFAKHGPLPRKSLVAAVPISLRVAGDTSSNTQASMSLVSLGTHLADPGRRLAHVMAANAAMKGTVGSLRRVLPTDYPSIGVPWLLEGLTALYGRAKVAERLPPFANVVISNVPGPSVPLYMAGAKMLTNQPASIVVHGVALNITVQTYDQSLEFGLVACARALPGIGELAAQLETAFLEFQALPAPPVSAEPAKVGAARKAAARKATPARKQASR